MSDEIARISTDLLSLGVRPGGVLLVHSSIRSLHHLLGGLETVVEALLTAIGESGTLLMPCLSYESVTTQSPLFDLHRTPSDVGALSEFFRLRPNTLRSVHPTHSVCGVGPLTRTLLGSHHLDETPVGPNSPLSKLPSVFGQILMLGCGLGPNTSLHGVEEVVRPPYLFGPEQTYTIVVPGNEPYRKTYVTHGFSGVVQRYERVSKIMPSGSINEGRVFGASSHLIESSTLWAASRIAMTDAPFFFVEPADPVTHRS